MRASATAAFPSGGGAAGGGTACGASAAGASGARARLFRKPRRCCRHRSSVPPRGTIAPPPGPCCGARHNHWNPGMGAPSASRWDEVDAARASAKLAPVPHHRKRGTHGHPGAGEDRDGRLRPVLQLRHRGPRVGQEDPDRRGLHAGLRPPRGRSVRAGLLLAHAAQRGRGRAAADAGLGRPRWDLQRGPAPDRRVPPLHPGDRRDPRRPRLRGALPRHDPVWQRAGIHRQPSA